MSDKTPITNIQNLFSNYKDEETVYAKEYNANTVAFKNAIEYNGVILKEHNEAIKTLSTGNIPKEGITSEQIALNAVTEDKLAQDIRDSMLFKDDSVAPYFGDFLTQLYKSHSTVRGVFMNGSISDVGFTFKIPTEYTTQVVQTNTLEVWQGSPSDNNKGEYVSITGIKNKYADSEYKLCPYCEDIYEVRKATAEWKTTYTLENAMNLDSGASLSFSYNACYSSGFSIVSAEADITFKIKSVDIYEKETDITDYFKVTKDSYNSNYKYYESKNVTYDSKNSLEGIKKIIVELTYKYWPSGSGSYSRFRPGTYVNDRNANYSKYTQQLYFSSGASLMSEDTPVKEYTGFAQTAGNLPRVQLCYKVKGTIPEENLQKCVITSIFCSADSFEGYDICKKQNYSPALYIETSKDPRVKRSVVNTQDTNVYLISEEFKAPYCIIFDLTETTELVDIGVCTPGTYKLTRNPYYGYDYIYDSNYAQVVKALIDDCTTTKAGISYKTIDNIKCVHFDIGASGVDFKLQSEIDALEIDSICAVRY